MPNLVIMRSFTHSVAPKFTKTRDLKLAIFFTKKCMPTGVRLAGSECYTFMFAEFATDSLKLRIFVTVDRCYGYVHCMALQRDIGSRESDVHASLIM